MLHAVTPRYAGKIWPNGKFGVSRIRETPFPSLCESHRRTHESEFNSLGIKAHGVEAVLRFRGKWEAVIHPDLSNVPNSPTRKKRGLKGITRHGRNLISSAAVLFEGKFQKELLTFATVTIPVAPNENLHALSRNWSQIVKQFVKSLRRGLTAKKIPSQVFGVTEIQMKRFQRLGQPALHLHLVFVGRNSKRSAWQINRKDIRRWWREAIAPYLPADTDYSSVENVTVVKKSVAAYLGKYMSKGVSAIEQVIEAGFEDWLPTAWYTISHELRRDVLAAVLRGEEVGNFLHWLGHNVIKDWVRWIAPVLISRPDGSNYAIGFAGSLTPAGLDKARQILV